MAPSCLPSMPYVCTKCTSKLPRFTVYRRYSSRVGLPPVLEPELQSQQRRVLSTELFYEQLNHYRDTTPPNALQLTYARNYFTRDVIPSYLLSAHKFRELPESDVPEVAFLGRSNVGKSSLLNVLFNRPNVPLANTSSKPGRTRSMNMFGIGKTSEYGVKLMAKTPNAHAKIVGRGGLVVVDMPGYGQGSREEWGLEIVKYLSQRKQLRRAFLLVDASHGLKPADWQILDIMRRNSVPHQIILSKADKVVELPGKVNIKTLKEGASSALQYKGLAEIRQISETILKDITPKGQQGVSALGEVLACSAEKIMFRRERMGIDGIRWAVLQATGRESNVKGLPITMGLAMPKAQNTTSANGESNSLRVRTGSTPRVRKINLERQNSLSGRVRKISFGE